MNLPEPIIELRGVTKRFDAFAAVDHVDLNIRGGEFLTLLGPSGCGKTTLLRLIAGFETADEGEVWIEGANATDVPPYRRNVNQVFQSYALFPHLTVSENVAFGLKMQKRPTAEVAQRVAEALALVSLQDFAHRKPDQLSGGQRQRVALARALAPRPAVLLLDEPLSALDAKLRRAMQIELKTLQRQLGVTFVFVTHDQEEALTISDRIAVVEHGRIEQLGSVDEIYAQPKTAFVAEFIGETNLVDAEFLASAAGRPLMRIAGVMDLELPMDVPRPTSRRVRVSIRPEKLHLSAEPSDGVPSFRATVESEVFKGATDHLVIVADNGLRLKVVVANESFLRSPVHRGDVILCSVHAKDVWVLPP